MTGTDLNELKKLYSKWEETKVPLKPTDGEMQATIKIKSIPLDEMDKFDVDPKSTLSDQKEQIISMLAYCLGRDKEEIKELSVTYIQDIMTEVMRINNVDKKTASNAQKALAFIKEKKAQAETQKVNPPEDEPTGQVKE